METTLNTSLPFDYCHRWIRAAFNMVEKHFSLFALAGLVVIASTAVVSVVPFIGSIVSPVLRFAYGIGSLILLDSLMQNQTHTLESYLKLCFDMELWKRFQKYLIVCATTGFLIEVIARANIPHFYLMAIVLYFALTLAPFMAFYQMRNPGVTEKQAFDFVMGCAWKNVGNLLMLAIFLIALSLVSMALCVVPYFLYFMPLTFPLTYLVYMGICEGKTIEEITQIWNSRGDSTIVQ